MLTVAFATAGYTHERRANVSISLSARTAISLALRQDCYCYTACIILAQRVTITLSSSLSGPRQAPSPSLLSRNVADVICLKRVS